jgi:hypothetical protein
MKQSKGGFTIRALYVQTTLENELQPGSNLAIGLLLLSWVRDGKVEMYIS